MGKRKRKVAKGLLGFSSFFRFVQAYFAISRAVGDRLTGGKEKNAKIVPFFYKEQKRTQRSFHSFIKNGKERKDQNILL